MFFISQPESFLNKLRDAGMGGKFGVLRGVGAPLGSFFCFQIISKCSVLYAVYVKQL